MIRKPIFLFLCSLSLVVTSYSSAQAPKKHWLIETKYTEPDMDLFNPVFSMDGRKMAYVRKGHTPDGLEAEGYSQKEMEILQAELDKKEKETHFEEPKVVLCLAGFKAGEEIGLGWSPAFSPDGNLLAYVQQVKSLAGLRTLGETMAGNRIELYDIKAKRTKDIAKPKTGDFTMPVFSDDGHHLFFTLSNAVTGAAEDDPGPVGLEEADLGNGAVTELIKPQMELKFPITLENFTELNNQVYAVVKKPLKATADTVFQYDCKLVCPLGNPKIVYSWGAQHAYGSNFSSIYHVFPDGTCLVFDKGWKKINISNGKVLGQSKGKINFSDESVSPNGKYLIGVNVDSDGDDESIYMIEIGKSGGEKVLRLGEEDQVNEMNWSPNSEKVAVVITKGGYQDEIMVFKKNF